VPQSLGISAAHLPQDQAEQLLNRSGQATDDRKSAIHARTGAAPKRKRHSSNVKNVLRWLIEQHGRKIGITELNFADYAEAHKVSRRNAERWLRAGDKALNKNSRAALAKLFAPALPQLRPDFFRAKTASQFARYLEEHSDNNVHIMLPSERPVVQPEVRQLAKLHLGGIWSLYRYSFDNMETIAREVLHVFEEGNRVLFRFHFRIGGLDLAEPAQSVGEVVPVGDAFLLIGLEASQATHMSRIRTLFLRQATHHPLAGKYRFGILSSISPTTREPCAARVLLSRVKLPSSDLEGFIRSHACFLKEEEFDKQVPANFAKTLKFIFSNRVKNQRGDRVLTTSSPIYYADLLGVDITHGD
jgi:hypothetical protein